MCTVSLSTEYIVRTMRGEKQGLNVPSVKCQNVFTLFSWIHNRQIVQIVLICPKTMASMCLSVPAQHADYYYFCPMFLSLKQTETIEAVPQHGSTTYASKL